MLSYTKIVKYLDWDEEKDLLLKVERGISFGDVVNAISENRLLDILRHPSRSRYRHQMILVVEIALYAYLVPFVEDEEKIFLKTIIPSRKATKKYIISQDKKK